MKDIIENENDWRLVATVPDGSPNETDLCKEWFDSEGKIRKKIWYPSGTISYYDKEGNWHRLDGPARQYNVSCREWFYHGKEIPCKSQEEFERWLKLKAFW